jgi:protein-S-isoprenylcysteine O-methyltransferase Ste14
MGSIKRLDFIYVTIQFVLLTIFFVPLIQDTFQSFFIIKYLGAIVSFLGFLIILLAILQLNKNLTPFPTPKENGELISTGLYKYIRHPIYTGIFLASLGIAFYNSTYWQLVISIILLILFYFKSKYEESLLIEKYSDYELYIKKTRRFF